MWNPFKGKIDWEREFEILVEHTFKLEKNLETSLEMNKKLIELLEKWK